MKPSEIIRCAKGGENILHFRVDALFIPTIPLSFRRGVRGEVNGNQSEKEIYNASKLLFQNHRKVAHMTLVVARKINNFISIVGDTKLSHPFENTSSPQSGVVKVVLISPTICIGFAGNIYHAEFALKNITDITTFDDVKEILYQTHLSSQQKTDFIIGNINKEKKQSSLFVIKNGEISETETAWIGSIRGFEKFQEHFHSDVKTLIAEEGITTFHLLRLPDESNEEQDIYHKMVEAMHAVIDDGSIEDVDGFVIPVAIEKNAFAYMTYMMAFRSAITPTELNQDGTPTPMSWGNAETGSLCINFAGSNTSILAIHMYQGNLGVIYQRQDNGLMYPSIFRNIDEIDFFILLKSMYGLVGGITINHTPDLFGKKGYVAFHNNDLLKAIEYFDKAMEIASRDWNEKNDSQRNYKYLSDCIDAEGVVHIPQKDVAIVKQILYFRGRAFMKLEIYDKALLNFLEVLSIDPGYVDGLKQKAISLYFLNNLEEAEKEFTAYSEKNPSADSYYSRGVFFLKTQRFDEARNDFSSALAYDPEHKLSYIALTMLLSITTNQNSPTIDFN